MCTEHEAILDRMIEGFSRFQKIWCQPDAHGNTPYSALLDGQEPKAMIVACSDSRVDPAIVLDAKPGELFVVRNVANLVPPYEPDDLKHGVSAALEYAVRFLNVTDVLVMGHARCGGFAGMLAHQKTKKTTFIDTWMETAAEAMGIADAELALGPERSIDERLSVYAMWGVRLSLRNLMTFPWVAERVHAKRLHLHGLYFDFLTSSLLRFDHEQNAFVALVPGVVIAPVDA